MIIKIKNPKENRRELQRKFNKKKITIYTKTIKGLICRHFINKIKIRPPNLSTTYITSLQPLINSFAD